MSVNIQTSSGLVKIAGTPTIDTDLSNISKNPVQNKVITEKINEINSNLTDLAFGENSGSANIFNGKIVGGLLIETGEVGGWTTTRITSDFIPVEPNTLYTQIAPTSAKGGRYCEYDANKNLVYFDPSGLQDTLTTKPTTKYLRISFGSEYGTTFKNDIAIIKGNATEYVPYIMSNKQLGALNESLSVIGKCKNLLNPTLQTTTLNGVTCTNNGDGTYTLNGTATYAVDLIVGEAETINGKQYLCNGVPVTLSDSSFNTTCIVIRTTDWKTVGKNGAVFTAESSKTKIAIHVESGVTVSNVVFKPMVTTDISATYDDFVPYTGDGETLTHDVAELKNDLSAVQSNTILNYESITVDLNSLTGHPLIASVNTGATNAPTGFGGGYMIVVYAGSSSAALYQTLVDVVNNKTYRRSLYHGSWSDWSLTAQ